MLIGDIYDKTISLSLMGFKPTSGHRSTFIISILITHEKYKQAENTASIDIHNTFSLILRAMFFINGLVI